MKFLNDFLNLEKKNEADVLWRTGVPESVVKDKDTVKIDMKFEKFKPDSFIRAEDNIFRKRQAIVRAYGPEIIRFTMSFDGAFPDDEANPMLDFAADLRISQLTIKGTPEGWKISDSDEKTRFRISRTEPKIRHWSNGLPPPPGAFKSSISPDGKVEIPFKSQDTFNQYHYESLGIGFIERNEKPISCNFSVHAEADEKFAGTGERFRKLDLAGSTIRLENDDALGVNSQRAYKNVPFYISSRGYGLLVMTSAHVKLSFADISTRAVVGLVEEPVLDLFFIGGGTPEKILRNYRRLTGFPPKLPLWSYGTWMSRMTYFSEKETKEVAGKLREGKFPCDVIHLDTGWFKTDWKCEWEFSKERFPDPEKYIADMRKQGFRITLWQLPSVAENSLHFDDAVKNKFIAVRKEKGKNASNFSDLTYGGSIDFSKQKAINWYKGLLKKLLKMGISAIKTDFGETIDMQAEYANISASLLHNLYALLYQQAAFEITEKTNGEGIIWARAGWTGCQRYPVHWGGDAAATWDGMAGSLKGGLHFGLSGFAYWSHDVPGFHGIPDFMNSWPDNDLYVRWTQFGVFTSHLRYHGCCPREPYEYPEVADIVREWLKLRYSLIPYIMSEARKACQTGMPLLRALIFNWFEDPMAWQVFDQYMFGDCFLVCPVMNSEGIRDIYLPEGEWCDFWTGENIRGPKLIKNFQSPLARMPVFILKNSIVPVYPEAVQHTGEMNLSKIVNIIINNDFHGISSALPWLKIEGY